MLPKPVVPDNTLEKAKAQYISNLAAQLIPEEKIKEAKVAGGFGPYTNILRCQTVAFDWF